MKKILLIVFIIVILITVYSISVTPTYDTLNISVALEKARATLKEDQKIVIFDSKNPFNFYDIFHRIDEISDQKVFGILTKPDNNGISPVIIGVAGSAGWGEHHYGYLERYLKMGFAVFSLHSFKSRGVESTVGEQLTVTIPMMIYDVFRALNKLSGDKNIDEYLIEIPATLGSLVAFKVEKNCWHGYTGFEGNRLSLQLNYLYEKSLVKHNLRHKLSSQTKKLIGLLFK